MKTIRWTVIIVLALFAALNLAPQARADCPELDITSPATLPSGTEGQSYSYQIQTSGGQPPISFIVLPSYPLPSGLNLSSSGLISGSTSDGAYSFKIRAIDSCSPVNQISQKTFSLTINGDSGSGGPKYELKKYELKVKPKPRYEIQEYEKAKATIKPKIESVFDDPVGALKPGSKLFLKGKGFGTKPGKILMSGNFQNSPVELINVNWKSNTEVTGFVPMSTNGAPNQSVKIMVMNSEIVTQGMFDLSNLSKPWPMSFEGREAKALNAGDVTVVQCGHDADKNRCNWKIVYDPEDDDVFITYCNNDTPICASHINIGLHGYEDGDDKFQINLKNGWVFKSLQQVTWYKSSSNEEITGPSPLFPVGKSSWSPVFHWVVSPGDSITYRYKINVEGPFGTNYK